jgi:tRNA modification GTPase
LDTIIACSSPQGQGGVALLRMSGSISISIAQKLSNRSSFRPRYATLVVLKHKEILLDQVVLFIMPNPNSFTGEDVVEINCHGNPLIVQQIIEACIDLGARMARPGEFTRRALENGKMSLLQAEALNGVIHARTVEGLQLVHKNLRGELDKGVSSLKERLLDICAELEAMLDHPDDDLSMLSDEEICTELRSIAKIATDSAENWKSNRIGLQGAKVALIGSVNAGKSSLFNTLLGYERAIVSDIPGTTRDAVEKSVRWNGLEICFLDTAGTRMNTEDSIEARGIALGLSMAKEVDLCILVFSLVQWERDKGILQKLDRLTEQVSPVPVLRVGTHLDQVSSDLPFDIVLSNKTKDGVDTLKKRILSILREKPSRGEAYTVVSQRQYELFLSLARHCHQAGDALLGIYGPAVAAEEITEALERISELTGEEVRERILDRLFSKFCIGK